MSLREKYMNMSLPQKIKLFAVVVGVITIVGGGIGAWTSINVKAEKAVINSENAVKTADNAERTAKNISRDIEIKMENKFIMLENKIDRGRIEDRENYNNIMRRIDEVPLNTGVMTGRNTKPDDWLGNNIFRHGY